MTLPSQFTSGIRASCELADRRIEIADAGAESGRWPDAVAEYGAHIARTFDWTADDVCWRALLDGIASALNDVERTLSH